MRRVLIVCSAFVAACQLPLAAAPLYEDVPVRENVASVSMSAGLSAAEHRAQFAADLIRIVYGGDFRLSQSVGRLLAGGSTGDPIATADPVLVPIPISAEFWRHVLHKSASDPDLLAHIVGDRRAALLCYGLAGMDDETRAFVRDHETIAGDIYDHAAPAFAAFASSVHVRSGRVAPPGGEAAVTLWESVVGQSVDRPDRFLHALLTEDSGRIAYLYDITSELDRPHAAFVLGSWITGESVRRERFRALAAAVVRGDREWTIDERPFVRPLHDFAMILMRLQVDTSGAPAAPASRAFWNGVFQLADSTPAASVQAERGAIDAAYLADAAGVADMYVRADRCDQFAFAQRVFGAGPGDDKDVADALRAMPRQRMLLLALERMGIRQPAVYVALARQARDATSADASRSFWTLAQLQGSLALLVRLHAAGTLDTPAAERLLLSLAKVPLRDGGYQGGIARWLDRELLPALPPGTGAEARLAAGVSGRVDDPANARVDWEGQRYTVDFAAANAQRIRAVREKQGGSSIDAALDLARLVDGRSAAPETSSAATARKLAAIAQRFPPRSRNALPETLAPGVVAPPPARDRIDRTLAVLEGSDEANRPDRIARVTGTLVDTADTAFAEALLSFVYAMDLGDPDGTALLASNVALRHDFGFGLQESELRARRPWDVPRQEFQPDGPWHVSGSLIGLDVALASLSLKHVDIDGNARAPRLRSTEREAFAAGATLMQPGALRDNDRAQIVAAMARGQARVTSLARNPGDLPAVADAVRMDGWRRQALEWTLAHESPAAPSMFSLVELLALGGGAPAADLDAWGPPANLSAGCLCTRMPVPGGWPLYEGRAQLAFISFVVADVNLRVAMLLDQMHLPSALERPVLAAAIQSVIEEAAPADDNDWLAVAQAAQALDRQHVEDYVAAAAVVGGPLVPIEAAASSAARTP